MSDPVFLPAVDDLLGPSDKRFFGSGYRRVEYRSSRLSIEKSQERLTLSGTVSVSPPVDWSTKGSRVQRPHLSTVDALILGVLAGECILRNAVELTAGQLAASWVKTIDIRAGTRPLEDELDHVELEATLVGDTPAADGNATLRVGCVVGNMTVSVEIVHPIAPAARVPVSTLRYVEPVGGLCIDRHPRIDNVAIHEMNESVTATVEVEHEHELPSGRSDDLERTFGEPVTLIDVFVVSLQLGQILLYSIDALDRASSDTLWMRHTHIEALGPHAASRPDPIARVRVQDSRVRTVRKRLWRTATLVGSYGGITMKCAVAHQLPDPSLARNNKEMA